MTRWLFVLHFAATWYLIGLCWFVQRVQYPLMERVGRAEFAAYEAAHVDRIGPVVAPAMLLPSLLGARIYRGLSPLAFRRVVLLLLSAAGLAMVAAGLPALLRR